MIAVSAWTARAQFFENALSDEDHLIDFLKPANAAGFLIEKLHDSPIAILVTFQMQICGEKL